MNNRRIWKYLVDVRDGASWLIQTSVGAKVVAVRGRDRNHLVDVWVEHDAAGETALLRLHIAGTGHDIPAGSEHVGTAFSDPFVWHIYRYSEERP